MLLSLHQLLKRSPRLFALAWDVAFTPTGSLIIEINAHGGWRSLFQQRILPALTRA